MSRWERFFAAIIHRRWWIVAIYAALTPLAIWWALSVPNDSAIERLIVATDPDYQRTQEFHRHFPEGKHALLLFQSDDPFRPDRLLALADLEQRLAGLEKLQAFSVVSTWLRLNPGSDLRNAHDALRAFATKTELFRRQGLVDREFIGIALTLAVESGPERDRLLAQVDASLAPIPPGLFSHQRRVGGPYVDSWLERETHQATLQYMPLFGLFVVALVWFVYRSWRALAALLIALAVSVLLGVAIATPLGFGFTIVSSLVPLTILITSTSTLVYLHSRFVDRPEQVSVERHQLFALSNKLLACTASVFAAAVGFAALAVSEIRPIRELGLWTAAALLLTWIVSFTLFPALQSILKTPTGLSHLNAGKLFLALAERIPLFTYRWRWPLVLSAILLCVLGAGALFGVPGQLQPMQLQVDSLDYIDPDAEVYRDTRYFEQKVGGLTTAQLWIRTPEAAIVDPDVLRALDQFAERVQRESGVNSVVGLTTLLRFRRYAAGLGESLPTEPAQLGALAADLEQLLLTEPAFAAFVDLATLSDTHLTLIGGASGEAGYQRLTRSVEAIWSEIQTAHPALSGCQMELVGQGLLQAKIAGHLVPTLVESFVLTAGVIFVAFLVVFRSGAARVMAMIPSLFAILAMFLVMRLFGMSLNVATILIASTVLGASENDQIHFFYHFGEKRRTGSVHQSLAHTLRVSGKAIFYATLINASGFLALALSPLPPMRQFGVISASAFLLSMLADFTALPAALWILMREKPDTTKET
jgi:hypothetical protein